MFSPPSRFRALVGISVVSAVATAVASFLACSSDSGSPVGTALVDASTADVTTSTPSDGAVSDSGGATVTGMQIVTVSGTPLGAAAGDAVALKVVQTMSDGTTRDLPAGTTVTWTAPATVSAQDPDDAGSSTLPAPGAQPAGIFIQNAFRPERTDYVGTLYVLDPGAADGGTLTVTASVGASSVNAVVPVSATPVGDPDAGSVLYNDTLRCAGCHGQTGGGTPPTDGGPEAGTVYIIGSTAYPYPAPGLNAAPGSGNLADDSDWNAALLGMAAQGDIDNLGVALRKPMPDWFGKNNSHGQKLSAQDFADIYAFLKTQTE